ncbi:MAG: ABC transporter permease, partial [Proteobacteria bacterium]|nr:ABC transporter permease [Pseudomonadota bacterium]
YYLIIILAALILLVVSRLVFNVQVKGSIFSLLVTLTFGSLSFSAIGIALAARIKKLQTLTIIGQIVVLTTFLSGVFFPVDVMPGFLQLLTKVLPLTHFLNAMRAIINQGEPLSAVLNQIGILTMWAFGCFLIALKIFKWE